MKKILEYISTATADEVPELLMALLERYKKVFPDWEMVVLSVERDGTAYEQISRAISRLEGIRENYNKNLE